MQVSQLRNHLNNEALKSAYLVTGEDSFLVSVAKGHFTKIIKDFPKLNITEFDGETTDISEIIMALSSFPFMGEKKLIFLSDIAKKNEREIKQLAKYLDNPNSSSTLVIIDKISDNFKPIMSYLEPVECNKLEDSKILNYIATKVTKAGESISPSAANLLIEYCLHKMSRIETETQKLISYSAGDFIDEAMVMRLVNPDMEYKVFELSDSIGSKNNEKAMKLLSNMLLDKVPVTQLLGLIYSHYRRLFFLSITSMSDDELATSMSVKPYAFKIARKQLPLYTPKQLKDICGILSKADYDYKSGKMESSLALTSAVMLILGNE